VGTATAEGSIAYDEHDHHHHHQQYHQMNHENEYPHQHHMATTAFHVSRPSHAMSAIVASSSSLNHTSIILDDDSFNASRIMENYQQQHHKIGGRSASSGLEELIMGCTPSSSTDIKEERSIRNPQEADWLKYSTFWPDQDHRYMGGPRRFSGVHKNAMDVCRAKPATNGDSSSFGDSVNKEGNGSWHSNDIKVDIPEYNGKLDPDEFVMWLQTVKLVFDYKQTTEENKVKIVALKLRKYASTWWSNVCLKRERLGKQRFERGQR
nr:NAC domain-containing protein [Tanacetum cinerariifolium]